MEYQTPFANSSPVLPPLSYFDIVSSQIQYTHDISNWSSTLNELHCQQKYLDGLLSKTATTLNALRDRQTRTEHVLTGLPFPRSKRKKIQQDKWRTNKTIKTCENEERVIINCLHTCTHNIKALEAMMQLTAHVLTTTAKYTSMNDAAVSPFQKERERSLPNDEIPPEACELQPAPPKATYGPFSRPSLSPEATMFQPSITNISAVGQLPQELDKLSITGLPTSKHLQLVQVSELKRAKSV